MLVTTSSSQPTVAEIAAQSLAAVRVFERHGIDYCCGGKRPLEEVCASKGLDPAVIESELQEALAGNADSGRDWAVAPVPVLIRHIVDVHHGYLRRELPAIARRLEKVYRVYNQRYGETLPGLPEAFQSLHASLDEHLLKEETEVFPAIESGRAIPGDLRDLGSEHEEAGDLLAQIRRITENYEIPDYACVTYRALMTGLRELEQDLHLHIHLENNILFPRALAAISQRRKSEGPRAPIRLQDALKGEHGAMYPLLAFLRVRTLHASLEEVKTLAACLGAVLVSHADIEDEVLRPPIEGHLPVPAPNADGSPGLTDHQVIRGLLQAVAEATEVVEARRLLQETVTDTYKHFEKEETKIFTIAEREMPEDLQFDLGSQWAARRGVRLP